MQGSVTITPSPVMMESIVFRQKLGLSFRQFDNNNGSTAQRTLSTTPRCLFGTPDAKLAKDLVREIELRNAISFGKRFNFDIIQGEPFPCAKKIRLNNSLPLSTDSDEENMDMDNSSYVWTETYDQEYMAMCNKASNESYKVGPNRHTVSLLFAPVTANHNHGSSSVNTCFNPISPQSRVGAAPTQSSASNESSVEQQPPQQQLSSAVKKEIQRKSFPKNGSTVSSSQDKNHLNTLSHHHHNHQPSAKKSCSAHQIIAKYTNRVLKHALKKPRKSIITDYMHMRRVKTNQVKKA